MTEKISFILNNESVSVDINPAAVLLDFIRNNKKLSGTKEGCKEGDCGACTVLVGTLNNKEVHYKTINSCLYPMGNLRNKHVVTIEGLNSVNLSPLQDLFVDEGASQCGFCTPGFIISITGALINLDNLTEDELINSIAGNICRCTGYTSIIKVIDKIRNKLQVQSDDSTNKIKQLIENNILPEYFEFIPKRLTEFEKTSEISHSGQADIFIAGGTDLYVQKPETIIDKKINFLIDKNLSYIKVKK